MRKRHSQQDASGRGSGIPEHSGVVGTRVGYIGGKTANRRKRGLHRPPATLKRRCGLRSGQTPYSSLLKVFWENHNPTQVNRRAGRGSAVSHRDLFPSPEQEVELGLRKKS